MHLRRGAGGTITRLRILAGPAGARSGAVDRAKHSTGRAEPQRGPRSSVSAVRTCRSCHAIRSGRTLAGSAAPTCAGCHGQPRRRRMAGSACSRGVSARARLALRARPRRRHAKARIPRSAARWGALLHLRGAETRMPAGARLGVRAFAGWIQPEPPARRPPRGVSCASAARRSTAPRFRRSGLAVELTHVPPAALAHSPYAARHHHDLRPATTFPGRPPGPLRRPGQRHDASRRYRPAR